MAQRQRELFPSKPALELEAKRLTPQPKTTAMCSRGGEMITAGSGVDPFGNNDIEVIDRGSLVGHQNNGLDRDSLMTYASRPTMAFIPLPYRPLSPLSSPSSFDDIEGGVPFLSPSDIIYYLDREHSDEGLGVFRLFQPEMKTENLELWIYSKITDLTSMATSNSEGGVLQDLVVVDEVEQNHSDLDDQFVEGLLRLQ